MSRIFISGHKGLVGSAIHNKLKDRKSDEIIVAEKKELDLLIKEQVESFFEKNCLEIVILAAAKVGGINANINYPADFLYENLQIQNNIFEACRKYNITKLVFLGSSCIYPKDCPQPMKEEYLLTGPLEPTNEGYALAKIAGLKMAEYYKKQYDLNTICPMPCNVYGNDDTFDLEKSHVMSALVKRFIDANKNNLEEVILWGTGIARREFIHVNDLADAIIFLMDNWNSTEIINVGTGKDIAIKVLAELIAKKVSFNGKISWDKTKPDGMLRKCLDITKLDNLGFKPKISLESGIEQLIEKYYQDNKRETLK